MDLDLEDSASSAQTQISVISWDITVGQNPGWVRTLTIRAGIFFLSTPTPGYDCIIRAVKDEGTKLTLILEVTTRGSLQFISQVLKEVVEKFI